MANTPSAKKRVRQIQRKTEVNKARKSRIKTFVRKVEEAIERMYRSEQQDMFLLKKNQILKH